MCFQFQSNFDAPLLSRRQKDTFCGAISAGGKCEFLPFQDLQEEASREQNWDLKKELPPRTRKDKPEPTSAVLVDDILLQL